MKKSRDHVFVAALEYESATLNALQALDAMPDRDRGLAYLKRRGGIPNFAWKRIHAFMEIFVANRTPTVH